MGTAERNATVTLYSDNAPIATTTTNTDGGYSVTATALDAGTFLFTAKATDLAGNTSIASGALSVTIDTSGDAGCPKPSTNLRFVPDYYVYAIAQIGCTLYVGGAFTRFGPNTGGGAPLSGATGQLTTAVPLTVAGSIYAVAPDDAGGWYIGGDFTQVGTATRKRLARIDGDGGLYDWNPNANSIVKAIAVSGATVYVGGSFTTLDGGTTRNRLAAIGTDGVIQSWNPNADNDVYALVASGSAVYAGGVFTKMSDAGRNYLAAIDLDGGLLAWNPNASNWVNALAVSGATVYAGGAFGTIGGAPRA